jgi:hypothetical protein
MKLLVERMITTCHRGYNKYDRGLVFLINHPIIQNSRKEKKEKKEKTYRKDRSRRKNAIPLTDICMIIWYWHFNKMWKSF